MIDTKVIKEVTPSELKELLTQENIQLIDVREPWEKEKADIGGALIPLSTVPSSLDKFNNLKQTVIYCRSGVRSANAIKFIEDQLGLKKLYNLRGGILAWADEIDSSIEKY